MHQLHIQDIGDLCLAKPREILVRQEILAVVYKKPEAEPIDIPDLDRQSIWVTLRGTHFVSP
jgi:hypothetical protein